MCSSRRARSRALGCRRRSVTTPLACTVRYVVGLENVTAIAPLARRLSSVRDPSAAATQSVSAAPSPVTLAPQPRVICGRMSSSRVATTIAIPASMWPASSASIVGGGSLTGGDCRPPREAFARLRAF